MFWEDNIIFPSNHICPTKTAGHTSIILWPCHSVSWLLEKLWNLVALGRASSPASHSWAQMESFSFAGFGFGISSPSLSIFSPLSTNSLTNVALSEKNRRTFNLTHTHTQGAVADPRDYLYFCLSDAANGIHLHPSVLLHLRCSTIARFFGHSTNRLCRLITCFSTKFFSIQFCFKGNLKDDRWTSTKSS